MVDPNGEEYFVMVNSTNDQTQSGTPSLKKKEGERIRSFTGESFVDPNAKTVEAVLFNGKYYIKMPKTDSYFANKEVQYEDLDEVLSVQKQRIEQLKTELQKKPTQKQYGEIIDSIV